MELGLLKDPFVFKGLELLGGLMDAIEDKENGDPFTAAQNIFCWYAKNKRAQFRDDKDRMDIFEYLETISKALKSELGRPRRSLLERHDV